MCRANRVITFSSVLLKKYRNPARLSQTLFWQREHFVNKIDGEPARILGLFSALANRGQGYVYLGFDEVSTVYDHKVGGTTYELTEFDPAEVIRDCSRCVENHQRRCDLSAWTKGHLEPQND